MSKKDIKEEDILCVCGSPINRRFYSHFAESWMCQCDKCKNVYYGSLGEIYGQIMALKKGKEYHLRGFFP